jgi:outer membrane protein assembly factor BamB
MTFTNPVALDGDTLYVGSNSGKTGIVALDADTVEERWRVDTGPVTGGPVVHDDLLVVQSHSLVVGYGTDGQRRWGFNLIDRNYHPLAVDDDHVYAAGRETLHAITHEGERSWTHEVAEERSQVGSPTIAGDSVLLRGEDRLLALAAATGEKQWSTTPAGRGEAVVTPDVVFLEGDGGELLALGEP